MISIQELQEKTGYDSFLRFKRNCRGSAPSLLSINLTKYFYDQAKMIELDMRPEELFMAADAEVAKKKSPKKKL